MLGPIFNRGLNLGLGEHEGTYKFGETKYLDLLGERAAVRGFTYRVQLSEAIHEFTVGNTSSVAELIFRSIEGTGPDPIDRVIYDADLAELAFERIGQAPAPPSP